MYCKFRYFPEGFIFSNSFKRHICYVKHSRLEHELPTSVNGSDIATLQGFYFGETSHSFVKIKPSQKFPNFEYFFVQIYGKMFRYMFGC